MKILFTLILCILLFIVFQINFRLYYEPQVSESGSLKYSEDFLLELRSLRSTMEKGAAVDMQKLFPEGYLFMNALYGLSWCELARIVDPSSDLYKEAHGEIQRSYESVDSDVARMIFDESLPLPFGAYYTGWNNYFLGKKLSIEKPTERNEKEITSFKERCEQIAQSMQRTTYPASYYHGAWPADVVMCVASLALHDELFKSKYDVVIKNWLGQVKNNLDENGLIPHSVHPSSGKMMEPARGSSQSLMLILLKDIDRDFAKEQFAVYKQLFLDYRFGLPGIREYPKGNSSIGDIDSGPVIFGMGGAATIVGMQTMYLYNEKPIAVSVRNGVEALGIPTTLFGKKRYVFGLMPMADAFITWSHSKSILPEEVRNDENSRRYQFHLYSLIPVILILLLLAYLWNVKLKRTSTS